MAAGWIIGGGRLREGCAGGARYLALLLFSVLLGGCAQQGAIRQQALPPLPDLQDRTESNAQAILAFVSADPGWQAWLQAMAASQAADDALVDTSTQDLPAWQLDAALTAAQDRYRRATSFYLVPVMMRSSCLNLPSETNGAVRLPSGLLLSYHSYTSAVHQFPNGSHCLRSTGFVSEVDSSRGIPIVTARAAQEINWQVNFAGNLAWSSPFAEISRDRSLSVGALMAIVQR